MTRCMQFAQLQFDADFDRGEVDQVSQVGQCSLHSKAARCSFFTWLARGNSRCSQRATLPEDLAARRENVPLNRDAAKHYTSFFYPFVVASSVHAYNFVSDAQYTQYVTSLVTLWPARCSAWGRGAFSQPDFCLDSEWREIVRCDRSLIMSCAITCSWVIRHSNFLVDSHSVCAVNKCLLEHTWFFSDRRGYSHNSDITDDALLQQQFN